MVMNVIAWGCIKGIMSLLAGFYFIIKSTLVLLITILNVPLNEEIILPL